MNTSANHRTRFAQLSRAAALFLSVIIMGLAIVNPVYGATIQVTSTGDPNPPVNGDGCTLREAIENANDNAKTWNDCAAGSGTDTISFNGSMTITLTFGTFTGEIFITEDLNITQAVTIDGGGVTRMFRIAGGADVNLENITLRNGKTDGAGGTVLIDNGTLTLLNCNLKNNVADGIGGAIAAAGINNDLDITNCSFTNNKGSDGGAIYQNSNGNMTIVNSRFVDNVAEASGGAIYVYGVGTITSTLFNKNKAKGASSTDGGGAIFFASDGDEIPYNIVASAFAGNVTTGAEARGGAIFNAFGSELAIEYSHFGTTPIPLPAPFNSLTDPNETQGTSGMGGAIYNRDIMLVLGSSFIGNKSASHGGAIANDATQGDNAQIANSTISSNIAVGRGGGVYQFGTSSVREIDLINVTVAQNTAAEGGGVYNAGTSDDVRLLNTIVHANLPGNCGGATVANGFGNLASGSACPATGDSDDQITQAGADLEPVELVFTPATIVTYTQGLGPNSSAHGIGGVLTCAFAPILSLDQRIFPRPQGGAFCDSGAYESDLAAEISVTRSGNVNVPDNGALNFGTLILGNPVTIILTIKNEGSARLNLANLSNAPAGFSRTEFGDTTINAGGTTTFSVTCNASSVNNFSGNITFNTNDSTDGESGYLINLSCSVNPPPTSTPTPSRTPTPPNTPTPGGPTVTPSNTPTNTATPVITGDELLVNRGFEDKNNAGNPRLAPWVIKFPTSDKIKCNKDGKIVSRTGNCAFMFVGGAGENSSITQEVVGAFGGGDILNLSLFANGRKNTANARVKLRVKYSDDTPTGKINLTIGKTNGYQLFFGAYTILSPNVTKVQVQIQNRSVSGKIYIDDTSLRQDASTRWVAPVVPLP